MPPASVLVSWSTGKDSAWALHTLKLQPDRYDVRGIFTTVTPHFDRVSIHGTPRRILRMQARRLGLPLYEVPIPFPCSNADYVAAMESFLSRIRQLDDDLRADTLAFGDLFLEDVRAYRLSLLRGTDFSALFPLWGLPTRALAQDMIAAGMRAIVTTVDPDGSLDRSHVGRWFDESFLDALPEAADPLGENGEFHTCLVDGPMLNRPIRARPGPIVGRTHDRSGKTVTAWYADVVLRPPG